MLLILLFFIIYFLFIIWLVQGAKKINKSNESHNSKIFLSIVVAVKNESKNLPLLINALDKQSLSKDKFEIIIINDHSNDETLNILNKFKNKISNLKFYNSDVIPVNWDRKMWALSKGIEFSKGEVILHTDGDCIPEFTWAQKILENFSDPKVGVVCGSTPLIGESFWGKILEIENFAQEAFGGMAVGHNFFFTCNGRSLAYRKKYFDSVGGYDRISKIIGGDDDLLIHKIIYEKNCKISFLIDDNTRVLSKCPQDTNSFINQRLRYASKVLSYYKLRFVSNELKLIMPFLFTINLLTCYSFIRLSYSGSILLICFILIKIISDYLLLYFFRLKVSQKIDLYHYLILSFVHPFYIIIFSIFGPILRIHWKEN